MWHVDEKVSHEDPAEITKFANYLAVIYGDALTMYRGQVHNYLRMNLDYSRKGKVEIGIIKYVNSILMGFLEELGAAEHWIQVQNEGKAEYLSEEKAHKFHHIIAQLFCSFSHY